MNLGKAIRLCRTQRNLTQAQLAAQAEMSVSYLSLLERDLRDPNFSTLEKVAKGLGLPVIILIFLADRSALPGYTTLSELLAYASLELLED